MQDPLPPPPKAMLRFLQPFAERLGLLTLPLHAHEIVGAFIFYHSIFLFLSPFVSRRLAHYRGLPRKSQINWHVRVVSTVQSTLICTLALYVIRNDGERRQTGWEERLWGYTGTSGMVQALAAGYFLWDLLVSVQYLNILGPGSLAHAISALLITCIGFRPFANYYGLNFILYELSTPNLNIHWFLDKLDMTGTTLQLINGICVMGAFFGCRLVWGTYQSLNIYSDVWSAWTSSSTITDHKNSANLEVARPYLFNNFRAPTDRTVPLWLLVLYLVSNTLLGLLNFYWFGKMIQAMRKRFEPPKPKSKQG